MPEINKVKALQEEPVPFLPLEEVAEIHNGKTDRHLAAGNVPVYGSGGIMRYANKAANGGPAVLVPRKGSLANIMYVDGPFWTVDTIFYTLAKDFIRPKFLYYYLLTQHIEDLNQAGGVPSLTQATLKRIRIPVPSLKVQEEIVRILDTFTSLEAELEAELEARKQQYTYLQNKLITKEQGSIHLLLGDIADIGTGNHDTKEAIPNGKYTFFARGREPLRLDTFDFDETSIITAGDGVGVGKVFHFAHGKYALHQRAYRIVPRQIVDSKYIYYYLVAKFPQYLQQVSVRSSVTSLRRPMLLRFPLCLPSISEQHRVATILDEFDTFQANLSCGIPAEIEARHKQYEYYRDRLLTFKELDHE